MQRYFDGMNWTSSYTPAAAQMRPQTPRSNTGRTLAIVFGVLSAVLVLFIVLAVIVGSGTKDNQSAGGTGGVSPPSAGANPTSSDRMGLMNQAVNDGKFTFTVTGVDQKDSLGSRQPRGKFVIVEITVKNTSKQEHSFQVNDQMLIGSNGAKYRADWLAAASINDENTLLLTLGPGFSANYRLPFDVPPDITAAKVELHDSAFSAGATVTLS